MKPDRNFTAGLIAAIICLLGLIAMYVYAVNLGEIG